MKQNRPKHSDRKTAFSSDLGYVVRIESREDAELFGSGTKWSCVLTIKNGVDFFPKYSKALFVACLKDGARYQIHPVAGVLDEKDQKVYGPDIPVDHRRFLKDALTVVAKPELILNPQRNLPFAFS